MLCDIHVIEIKANSVQFQINCLFELSLAITRIGLKGLQVTELEQYLEVSRIIIIAIIRIINQEL